MPDEKNKKDETGPAEENPIGALTELADSIGRATSALSKPVAAASSSLEILAKLATPSYDLVAEMFKSVPQYPNLPTITSRGVPANSRGTYLPLGSADAPGRGSMVVGPSYEIESGIKVRGVLDSGLTKKEIEEMIDKKLPAKKDEGLKREEVINLLKEIKENENNQETEKILTMNKKGLEVIVHELSNGGERDWRCAKCGNQLDVFRGQEGIEKIKSCLLSFHNKIPQKCKNGHQNWFEISEDGIVWHVKVAFEKEFRHKKD